MHAVAGARATPQVVLEGYHSPTVTAEWGGDDRMSYPVTVLDEELSAFFK